MSDDVVCTIFTGHFTNRGVVVVGAARGIGRGVADAFATSGATVHLVDASATVHETARELAAQGAEITAEVADVTVEAQVKGVFEGLGARWGALEVLVNNAGIITIGDLAETTTVEFERVTSVNTTGTFVACREAYPTLRANGGGVILNAASGQARRGSSTPRAMRRRSSAWSGSPSRWRRSSPRTASGSTRTAPGLSRRRCGTTTTGSGASGSATTSRANSCRSGSPESLGCGATNGDIANALLSLAPDVPSYITGQALNIDGGMLMS